MSSKRRFDDEQAISTDEPTMSSPVRRTPEEWRLLHGTRASHYACARISHGWTEHEHHEGVPIQITEAAYFEALEAGAQPVPVPSPNALSPHRGRGR